MPISKITGVAISALIAFQAYADNINVNLGSHDRVAALYSFPDNCSVSHKCDWTLEQTVAHYLLQSTLRDGYPAATVTVTDTPSQVTAAINGVPADYGDKLTSFLNAGDLGVAGAAKLQAAGGWQSGWYSFLPLGMALENRHSVELLHFPPDYSLTDAHDYLESKTTDRWASLLVLNGVASTDTPSYQTIIDIAPIAAPASAGSTLAGVYSYYTQYQTTMVTQWTQFIGKSNASYPMVAFGGPVRAWVKAQYGASVNVLQLGNIQPAPGRTVAVLGANHPSYIWYAADPANHDGDEDAANKAGIEVMGQDLVAACWQATLGLKPASKPATVLSSCKKTWPANSAKVCVQFYTSIRNLTPDQAKQKCATH